MMNLHICVGCDDVIENEDATTVHGEVYHVWCAPHWSSDLEDWREDSI